MKLRDGIYIARCKEKNALSAGANGHSLVYPQARCTVRKDMAIFDRDGKKVWRRNAAYAELHFLLERL